jgi:hypothetical protein
MDPIPPWTSLRAGLLLNRRAQQHGPASTLGGVAPGVFITQRMADTARVPSSGPVMNSAAAAAIFSGSLSELTLRPGTHIELPPADRTG